MTEVIEQLPGRRVQVFAGDAGHEAIYIDVPEAPWTLRDRAAWRWPSKLRPAAWPEKYRYLRRSAIPGPWRNENAPYLVGIMNLADAKGVVELDVKKAVQLGVSQGMRCLMGYWAQQDPAPMGLLLPNQEKGEQIVKNDVIPLFKEEFARHAELRELLSPRMHDIKKGEIKLINEFLLYLMWSGSAASMAANPMKRALGDECDKFEPWTGNDADPISLVRYRMRTYADRLLMLVSSPTTPLGPISVHFEQAHYRLYYLVACVHCSCRQRLIFGEGGEHGVKWTKEVRDLWKAGEHEKAAMQAMLPGNVWYQCCQCHGVIDERQKRQMVRAGKWGTVGEDHVRADGEIEDAEAVATWAPETKLGLQISSLYCVWESWTLAHVAAEFLQARTLQQKFAFRTSTLGETWAQAAATTAIEVIDERVKEAEFEEGVVPAWCGRLIGVADTQKDHFWLVIRAWGPGMRSQRVWHGRVESFAEIEQWCWKTPWKNADARLPARICDLVLIDSGGTKKYEEEEREGRPLPSRVMDVYAWVLAHQAGARAIKGDNKPEGAQMYKRGKGEYVGEGGKDRRPVPLWLLNVHWLHDQLADLMDQREPVIDFATGEETGKAPVWALNKRMDPEYHRHLTAMHKETLTERGKISQRWVPKREGMRVDYRACEAYQVAGAFMAGVHLLPDMRAFMAVVEAEVARRAASTAAAGAGDQEQSNGMRTPDGRAFVATNR